MVKNLCLFPERLKGKIFVSESHILSLARKKVEKKKKERTDTLQQWQNDLRLEHHSGTLTLFSLLGNLSPTSV